MIIVLLLKLEISEPVETRFSKVAHMKYDEFSHLGNPDDLLKSYITNEYSSLDFKISNSKCIRCMSFSCFS